MAKKNQFDLFKFVPIGVLAVTFIAGYVTLKNDVANAKDTLKSYEVVQEKLSADSTEVKISQAKTEQKVETMIELLKEIKSKL